MDITSATAQREERVQADAATQPSPDVRYWIVPHTHWDREWYIPFQVIRLRLIRMVDELMDTLEADPSFTSFTLDGQAIVLEDYLAARPDSKERLTKLIQEGRIRIGPSYILPDEYLVGQESLVRNLLLGRSVCRQYGQEIPVAYYPDTFGHVAQMPQIIKGFVMDSYVFWRGLGDESDRLGIAFRWIGPDGSEVLAIRQIDGYGSLDNLGRWARGIRSDDPNRFTELALRRLKELHETARPYMERSGVIDLLAGNGTDHQRVQADLPSMLSGCSFAWPQAEFRIAGLDEYVDAIRHRMPYLDSFEGEMCHGKDAPVLRGVNSARIYLKQRNEAVERALLEAEIASSLASLMGAEYPAEDLRMAWFYLLRNHPHDSICGCSVDEVHRDMCWRFDASDHITRRLKREALWNLAGSEAIWSYQERPSPQRSVVNLLPWSRSGLVELPLPNEMAFARSIKATGPDGDLPVQIIQNDHHEPCALVAASVDGFGVRPIKLSSGVSKATGARQVGYQAIENEYYRVEALNDGTLDILHKPSGRRLSGAHWFEDQGDRGDEYNFDPVRGEHRWDSRHQRVRVKAGHRGPALATLLIHINARLPQGLRPDRKARRKANVNCPITVEVRLIAGVDRVEFVTTVDNRAEDHRLRVRFPAGKAEKVRVEGHYTVLERPVGVIAHGEGWKEEPIPTHHTLGAVEGDGTLIIGKGLPEYEACTGDRGTEIALTLLRCVGWLSREDLVSRPGWAGPGLKTPEAQCLGVHRFEYALALVDDCADSDLVRRSHDYRHGLSAGPSGLPSASLLPLEGHGFCLAALKGAEDGDGVILRVYNPSRHDEASLSLPEGYEVQRVRLDEEQEAKPFTGALRPGEIVSLRLKRKKG
ncbi:MAG: alpha-mannosidase [Chloroflexota bacterium]|jgi:mannosylglycerate hydrolase